MARFETMMSDDDRLDEDERGDGDFQVLVDTQTGEILHRDTPDCPEDAFLFRDLSWIAPLLNQLWEDGQKA